MSRCFPFPPPGYTRNSDALIESIKLQSEIKKSKKDRKKERKREKKDKESKKEKRKDRKGEEGSSVYANGGGKKIKLDELEKQSGCVPERLYNENERVERSDITEEHYRPVTTPDPCCSDSTLSSNKRKRSISPSRHDHGTIKKFRFSLTKHTAAEESKLGTAVCPSRIVKGTADSLAHDAFGGNPPLPCITSTKRDHCSRDSRHCVALQSLPNGAAHNTNVLVDDEGMRMVSMYNSLIQNWVPPPAKSDGFDSDGQDWLFRSERKERHVSKTVKVVTGTLLCSSPSLWPRAQYLPEVELYALPYTVPF